MKTVTVRTDIPESREVRLQLPHDVPSGPVDIVLVISPAEPAAKRTLGDLLDSEFFGMWRDREDITDSAEYARALREDAWKRSP